MDTPPRTRDWEERYRNEDVESMPWFFPDLDGDFKRELEALGLTSGRVLDLGTGPGTQAIALAKLGFQVTGADVSPSAVRKARERASREGIAVEFIRDDILDSRLSGPFDIAFDRGCFHTIPPERRRDYIGAVHRILRPGGILMLKCFSHLEPGEEGPYRFTTREIRTLFRPRFEVGSIEESTFEGTRKPNPRALFCIIKRPLDPSFPA